MHGLVVDDRQRLARKSSGECRLMRYAYATAVVFCSMLTESGVGEVLDSASGLAGEVHEHHIRPGVAA